jgi:hypothetical protein
MAINMRVRVRVKRLGNSALHVENVNACQQQFISWGNGALSATCRGGRWMLGGERVSSPKQLLRVAIRVITR